ncbi:MAG: polyribonucleotide nucleotidyltransferase [Candidatus Aureabacteria bacterium]|nr:polyribonucleotide nucleotidyltransferase [Candidatus Auribacterota bacterium]
MSTKINGKDLIIETGKIAKQAHGSCTVQYGDTVVLCTVTCSPEAREGVDFFPLTVDYREKTSAAGMFPGGYIKREGRPTEKEILTMRLTDRPLRPLFPSGFRKEVQIMNAVLSADDENDPDILSVIGAAVACLISPLPFVTPVGCVRIGRIAGKWIVNPTYAEENQSDLDLVVAGSADAIIMVEGSAKEMSEQEMLEALSVAQENIKLITAMEEELRAKINIEKELVVAATIDPAVTAAVEEFLREKLEKSILVKGKKNREESLRGLFQEMCARIKEQFPDLDDPTLAELFGKSEKKKVRQLVVDKGLRADGRRVDEIRPISCEVAILPRTHGSALFTRGETQALAITTLGTPQDAQRLEAYEGETSKCFMLHYNFPPFSVGEVRPVRGPARREIGHGNLAERALAGVIPKDYMYTVRVVSDILESNGSSSMASVCGGSLALMDAGVPLPRSVAGIAMGLVQVEGRAIILSDILGSEDACGDMDFKVAGTKSGITAFQLDSKIMGIRAEVLGEALEKARAGRLAILDIMDAVLDKPRPAVSKYAPQIVKLKISPEKIGALIGPKGKVIKKICQDTGAEIDVEDDGTVSISSNNEESLKRALDEVNQRTADVEIGKIYKGIVTSVVDFGAFVEIMPGKEGLVHISKLADYRVAKVSDILKVGDEVMVKAMDIDEQGRVSLSRKAALTGVEGITEEESSRPPRRQQHNPHRSRRD